MALEEAEAAAQGSVEMAAAATEARESATAELAAAARLGSVPAADWAPVVSAAAVERESVAAVGAAAAEPAATR